jgi:hypothetical protein
LASALQDLTITRPDLAFAVQQLCLHMHDLRVPHLALLKRLLWYVHGTTKPRPLSPRLAVSRRHGVLQRGHGSLPGHSAIYVGLLCLPGRRAGLLVIQATTDHLSFQRGGRVPCRRQHCY